MTPPGPARPEIGAKTAADGLRARPSRARSGARRLLRVEIPDRRAADDFVASLMGKDPKERRLLIREGAPDPAALDL